MLLAGGIGYSKAAAVGVEQVGAGVAGDAARGQLGSCRTRQASVRAHMAAPNGQAVKRRIRQLLKGTNILEYTRNRMYAVSLVEADCF